jgi:hypothetical protein
LRAADGVSKSFRVLLKEIRRLGVGHGRAVQQLSIETVANRVVVLVVVEDVDASVPIERYFHSVFNPIEIESAACCSFDDIMISKAHGYEMVCFICAATTQAQCNS